MKVEPFGGDSALLSQLVSDWAFKPYRWAAVSQDGLHALGFARMQQAVEREGVRAWVVREDGRAIGLATLEPLHWDSRMLGLPAARTELLALGEYGPRRGAYEALLARVLAEGRTAGIEHLSVRVDAADDGAIHALESSTFLSVDALLTFEREVRNAESAAASPELQIRDARPDDVAAIERMSAASFLDGRFHADPSIEPATAASIYREWGASCCRGSAADGTLVAASGSGEVLGFVAWRVHADTGVHLGRLTASIVLIATASSARRRGVGRAIVMAALHAVERQSVVAMQVGTQIGNTGAARLYERCGFRLVTGSLSFRAAIDPPARPESDG